MKTKFWDTPMRVPIGSERPTVGPWTSPSTSQKPVAGRELPRRFTRCSFSFCGSRATSMPTLASRFQIRPACDFIRSSALSRWEFIGRLGINRAPGMTFPGGACDYNQRIIRRQNRCLFERPSSGWIFRRPSSQQNLRFKHEKAKFNVLVVYVLGLFDCLPRDGQGGLVADSFNFRLAG